MACDYDFVRVMRHNLDLVEEANVTTNVYPIKWSKIGIQLLYPAINSEDPPNPG